MSAFFFHSDLPKQPEECVENRFELAEQMKVDVKQNKQRKNIVLVIRFHCANWRNHCEKVQGYTNAIPHIANFLERRQRILLPVILNSH